MSGTATGAGFASAAYSLDSAIKAGDVPGIISGVAGVLAAIPGPQSTGAGIAATGLAATTAGAHAQQPKGSETFTF